MDDQWDAPTKKIEGKDRESETKTAAGQDMPTRKVSRVEQWQLHPEPSGRHAVHSVETQILDRRPPTFAWLIVVIGPQAGEIHRLSAEVTSIGRDASNTLRLSDEFVSRQHAKVRAEEEDDGQTHFYLYDLASSGGVFVNGERVYRHRLLDGDRVRLGKTELVFKQPAKLVVKELDSD